MSATVCKTCGHAYHGASPVQCVDCHGTVFVSRDLAYEAKTKANVQRDPIMESEWMIGCRTADDIAKQQEIVEELRRIDNPQGSTP